MSDRTKAVFGLLTLVALIAVGISIGVATLWPEREAGPRYDCITSEVGPDGSRACVSIRSLPKGAPSSISGR